jgi:peptide deformylase
MAEDQVEVTEQDDEHAEGDERQAPPPMDPEVLARRRAALEHVRKWGDPALKSKALPITIFDDELRKEVAAMGQLMDDALGVGLASTQLGNLRRLLVYRIVQDGPLGVLINPEIEWRSKDEEWYEEGCLSLPNVHVDVERPVHVRVRAEDEWGEQQLIEASGLEARVIQHEMDHLDGVLILERAPRDQRKEAMRALRAWADEREPVA